MPCTSVPSKLAFQPTAPGSAGWTGQEDVRESILSGINASELEGLRAFRHEVYRRLGWRLDALFELLDALVSAPTFRRGWGSLYDALNAGAMPYASSNHWWLRIRGPARRPRMPSMPGSGHAAMPKPVPSGAVTTILPALPRPAYHRLPLSFGATIRPRLGSADGGCYDTQEEQRSRGLR